MISRKMYLILAITLMVLAGCDNREKSLNAINDAPYFSLDGDPVTEISDSLKMSQGAYTIGVEFMDPNHNLSDLLIEIIVGNGSFTVNGIPVSGSTISLKSQIGNLSYVPGQTGEHQMVLNMTDTFGESADLQIGLTVFENIPPSAIFEISKSQDSGPFERLIDASGSFDGDTKFGGSIIQYEFSFLNKTVLVTKETQIVIFPASGTYQVMVRVLDNDGVWSDPVTKNETI